MDAYCYYVAGVVGELLTELFCTHCDDVAARRERLKCLGISFGLGLQMTNILKDLWDDLDRGGCWLPRETFARHGFNLDDLRPGQTDPAFREGLREMIGVTRTHLENALNYTLLIPPKHRGVRQFCLWAIGMAVLTLRNLNQNPGFQSGREVKITRRTVWWVVAGSRLIGGNNYLLRKVFRHLTRGLPAHPASIPDRPAARDH
jgi:farnesyl-diphosphate farnesyltransferase